MSKFAVRAEHNGKVRLIEFDRQATFNLEALELAVINAFELPGVEIRYAPSPASQQVLRQDFHLENAFKDSVSNRRRFFEVNVVSSIGGGRSSSPSSSSAAPSVSVSAAAAAASPVSSRAAGSSSSSGSRAFDALLSGVGKEGSDVSGTSSVKFCGNCGSAVVGGKFCSSCGKPVVSPISTEAPANLSPSLSGRLAASERKNRRVSAPYPKASATSKSSCAGCGVSVGLDGVSALEKLWHKECFVCFMCSTTLLDKGFKRYEDAPVCSNCYSEVTGLKCAACQKIISTAYMEIQGKNYHAECFVCSQCKSPFVGGSYLRGKSGEFLCKPCAQTP